MFDATEGKYILSTTSAHFERFIQLRDGYAAEDHSTVPFNFDGEGRIYIGGVLSAPEPVSPVSVDPSLAVGHAVGLGKAYAATLAAKHNICIECLRSKLTVNDYGRVCRQCKLERY